MKMNRSLLILLIAFFMLPIVEEVQAQQSRPFAEFKFGTRNPEDTGTGNFFGVSTGRRLDDRLYWGIEFDYFKSSYLKETTIATDTTGGITVNTRVLELEFATRIASLQMQIYYELKLGKQSPFYYRASVGAGGEFIWNNENNFVQDIERTRFFSGFGWKAATGIALKVSRSGVIFWDIAYNNATARKNRERNEEGLPIFQEIDVSGFGFQVGINIIGLGF